MKPGKDIATVLHEQGYRLTPQRMMVLKAIEDGKDHISAEEIYAQIQTKYPQVNISTVYRTLELLEKLGLVTETELEDRKLRYHLAEKGHHHHLVCERCGAKFEMDESLLSPLRDILWQKYRFRADLRHLVIRGRCSKC